MVEPRRRRATRPAPRAPAPGERPAHRADVTLEGDRDAFRALWFLGGTPAELIADRALRVAGDPAAFRALLGAFGPPRMASEPRA